MGRMQDAHPIHPPPEGPLASYQGGAQERDTNQRRPADRCWRVLLRTAGQRNPRASRCPTRAANPQVLPRDREPHARHYHDLPQDKDQRSVGEVERGASQQNRPTHRPRRAPPLPAVRLHGSLAVHHSPSVCHPRHWGRRQLHCAQPRLRLASRCLHRHRHLRARPRDRPAARADRGG